MLNKIDYSKAFLKAISEKIQENACKAGKGLKDYVSDDKNIWHLSLVVYDIMPLSIKIAMRHELFYKRFEVVFKGLRNKVFKVEEVKPVRKGNKSQSSKNKTTKKTSTATKKTTPTKRAVKSVSKKTSS